MLPSHSCFRRFRRFRFGSFGLVRFRRRRSRCRRSRCVWELRLVCWNVVQRAVIMVDSAAMMAMRRLLVI